MNNEVPAYFVYVLLLYADYIVHRSVVTSSAFYTQTADTRLFNIVHFILAVHL